LSQSEYTRKVLSCLRRVTKAERETIREEIDAHMEDHICALLDLGYPRDLAEERTMRLMGDPEEVGRELNKQYPFCWLLLKWAAMAVAALLAVMLLTQVSWKNVYWNLHYRFAPDPVNYYDTEAFNFLWDHSVDLRMEIDSITVRVCAAGIMKTGDYPYWGTWEDVPDTVHLAAVTLCTYNTDWRDLEVRRGIPTMFQIAGARQGAGATGSAEVWIIPVEPGQESVTATYQRYAHDLSMEIPLNWEGVE